MPKQEIDSRATNITKRRYDRIARFYDLMETVMERLLFRTWRNLVWQAVISATEILEIGVGTGKNMAYYPKNSKITAIDLSDRMLALARKRAEIANIKNVDLMQMDAQALIFPDDSFDAVVATFVYCSVPDPVLGLREIKRVLRPDGKAVFLEHMYPENPLLGRIFDLLNPIVVRIWGANINRQTLANIQKAGLEIQMVNNLSRYGIFRLIIARPRK
jgi:ubiquinone/menaquinone biosynthesis C-methylase UbiE